MIPIEQLQLRIAQLDQALTENLPSYKNELEQIRILLQSDPEQIHLLKPEGELSVIFAAMQKYKQVEIPIPAAKAEASKLRKTPITLDSF